MVNVNKIKGKMTEKEINAETMAKALGIDKSTFYRKLNSGGTNFSVGEAYIISMRLNLTKDEVNDIFFAQESHDMRN